MRARQDTEESEARGEPARPRKRPASPTAAPTGAPSPALVLELQRSAGNAAVARALSGPARLAQVGRQRVRGLETAVLQRFVGPEHEALGNVTHQQVDLGHGVVLTWGQLVAIAGDEYASIEELRADAETPDGRARIRAALEHDQVPGTVAATLPEPSAEQRAQHNLRYVQLAMQNVEHFAAGGTAVQTWGAHHARALDEALRAGLSGDPAAYQHAMATEAFGQHYLTDAFSGGHIRTPRREITDFYVNDFAPRVVDGFLDRVRARAVDEIFLQVRPQASGLIPDGIIRGRIREAVNTRLEAAITAIGGRAELVRWFGLALAGGVSGAIHDEEGERGVMVNSEAHPEPWRAYGDDRLHMSPVSRDQAELAVLTAQEDLQKAYLAGDAERVTRTRADAPLPDKVFFAFNSSAVTGEAAEAVATAAAHMLYHPEAHVELVGHTDPIGTDDFNEGLGQRRAEAVGAMIVGRGVEPERVRTRSEGERVPVSTLPLTYRENRRVEFAWQSRADGVPPDDGVSRDEGLERAHRALAAEVGPPYRRVERFIPTAVDDQDSLLEANPPVPEWRWGRMPPEMRDSLDRWVQGQVRGQVAGLISNPALDDLTVEGYTVRPRPVVQGIVDDLLANPTQFLGELLGEAAGPPRPP